MPEYEIGLDTRMLYNTGIGNYLKGVIQSWDERSVQAPALTLFGPADNWTSKLKFKTVPFDSKIYSIREQACYLSRVKQCRLWHAPHYNIPFLKPNYVKLVVTVHDLIHWVFKNQFYSKLQQQYVSVMMRRVVQTSDHIIAVSNKTRDDLIQYFKADGKKISVIYEAARPIFKKIEDASRIKQARERHGIPEKYFLFVGSLKPHKNILWLTRVFKRLRREGKIRAFLVLAGKKDRVYPAGYEELSRLQDGDGILHRPFIYDDDLVALYNGTLSLVHPSLYEGFGLTLLEAMKCGTPVIASRVASIPEVTGDAAILFDSMDELQLEKALVQMESHETLRSRYIEKGFVQAAKFNWDQTAEQTAEVYERVLTGS